MGNGDEWMEKHCMEWMEWGVEKEEMAWGFFCHVSDYHVLRLGYGGWDLGNVWDLGSVSRQWFLHKPPAISPAALRSTPASTFRRLKSDKPTDFPLVDCVLHCFPQTS